MRYRIFTLSGKRFAAGTWDKGIFTNGAATDLSITCGVQQPQPDDLELLEEGKRTRKSIVVYTDTQLNLASKTTNADWLSYENEWYEVNVLKGFKTLFPGQYKAICTKIENPGDVPVPPEPEEP